jgi:lipid A disaccharide synthetase
VNAQGKVVQVTRKPFTRRIIKPDVWKYHLRQMAAAEDPIDYLCRFLPAQDQIALNDARPVPLAARA